MKGTAGGESWFNDSFETESAYDVRYATLAEVNNPGIYEFVPDPPSNNDGNEGEDLYEDPDSMDITLSRSPGENIEVYECPADAMEYGNVNSEPHGFTIYDDTL